MTDLALSFSLCVFILSTYVLEARESREDIRRGEEDILREAGKI